MNIQTPISDDACKQLWCAVLHQSIDDATAPRPEREKYKTAAQHASAVNEWKRAREYIGGPSFRYVCWLCGLDPEAVEDRVRPQMVRE